MAKLKKKTNAKASKRTSDAVKILHRRYLENDPEMARLVAEELANLQIAQKIFDLRTKAGLSQRALAKLVGTTASVICRLEDADYDRHSLGMLTRIAAALNKRVDIRFISEKKTAQRA
jgi:ribosome-binding protein aMBF1 (putative translation factor)